MNIIVFGIKFYIKKEYIYLMIGILISILLFAGYYIDMNKPYVFYADEENYEMIVKKEENIKISKDMNNIEYKSGNSSLYNEVPAENNKVNINTADNEKLILLNGIGEVKANDIIDYREENGDFKKIEELVNVKGIGEKTFMKIKEYISIE